MSRKIYHVQQRNFEESVICFYNTSYVNGACGDIFSTLLIVLFTGGFE